MNAGYAFNLGRAFLAISAANADRPAIRHGAREEVSYTGLSRLAQKVGAGLANRRIGRGRVVAIQNSKTPEGYAAMLGCLVAGAAYTHLDPANPVQRLSMILRTCQPALVLVDDAASPAVADAARDAGIHVLSVSDLISRAGEAPPAAEEPVGSDPAYIMFTSGSTGQPKGVAISHASVLNFVAWSRKTFDIGRQDVIANVNPIYFDNSVFDVYSAFFTGACLAPLKAHEVADPAALVRRVDELGCTTWFSVPSLLIYLTTMKALRPDVFRSVRSIVFGGEGYPKGELAKLYALFGDRCRLVNVYGPTEGTCICSAYDISEADLVDRSGLPPLGRIADNFTFQILEGDTPVASGTIGELCLGGPQLALGYFNDPERTAASFTRDPLAKMLPSRIYRTGDLVRLEGEVLHFAGRKDNQIKHMGYRIELEEIEAAIAAIQGVIQAAVVYQRQRQQVGRIVAYVASNGSTDPGALRAEIAKTLPPYMLPTRIIFLDNLPKNANGKIDRARLASST